MKKSNTLKIMIVIEAVVLVVLVAFLVSHFGASEAENLPSVSTAATEQTMATTETVQTEPTETSAETIGTEAVTVEPSTAETVTPETTTPPPETTAPIIYVPDPVPDITVDPWIHFPYQIPDTTLVIENINSYDGIFLEDGSDTPISGVAAAIIRNNGDECVDYANIVLSGTKTNMKFVLSGLESGASVVVMETGKVPAVDQNYDAVKADVAVADFFEMSETLISVEEMEDGRLQITNITDHDIPLARLFYKFYMQDENVYVGGITYTVKIENLQAGSTVQVSPSHYAVGSSKVVMVKTYDETNQ